MIGTVILLLEPRFQVFKPPYKGDHFHVDWFKIHLPTCAREMSPATKRKITYIHYRQFAYNSRKDVIHFFMRKDLKKKKYLSIE